MYQSIQDIPELNEKLTAILAGNDKERSKP